ERGGRRESLLPEKRDRGVKTRNRALVDFSKAGRDWSGPPRTVVKSSDGRSARDMDRLDHGDRPAGSDGNGNGFAAGGHHAHGPEACSAPDRDGSTAIRVLVADDHPVYRDGLTALI